MANSHATKKPLSPTSAAMAASLPSNTVGESQCSLIASAMGDVARNKNKKFIARVQPVHPRPCRDRTLPARFRYARDEPLRSQLAKRETRNLEPAKKRAAPTRNFTAVYDTAGSCIGRQLCETSIIPFRRYVRSSRGVLLHRRAFAVRACSS